MDLEKKLEQIKPYQLNCNVFSVYDFPETYTIQELLNKFFDTINNCVDLSNNVLDLSKWLVSEGLSLEVSKKLNEWLIDGTLSNVINEKLFKDLNTKLTATENVVDIRQYGIQIKDVDQTNEIVNLFKTSLSGYEGIVYIPYGIKFNIESVYKTVGIGTILHDDSLNSYNSGSYRVKKFGYASPGDTVDNDSIFEIGSGHHPAIVLNNYKYTNSDSANKSYATILFADGFRNSGNGRIVDDYMILQGGINPNKNKYRVSIRTQKLFANQTNRVDSTIFEVDEVGRLDIGGGIKLEPKSYDSSQRVMIHGYSPNEDSQCLLQAGKKSFNNVINQNGLAQTIVNGNVKVDYNIDGTTTFRGSEKISIEKIKTVDIDATDKRFISLNLPTVNNINVSNMVDGQILTIFFENANATLLNTVFKLKGNVSYNPTQFSSITLLKRTDLTSTPIEIGRTEI